MDQYINDLKAKILSLTREYSALRGVIAQRLVRKPCPHCSSTHPNNELLIKRHEKLISKYSSPDAPIVFKQINLNTSCTHCSGRGYVGRTSIMEVYSLIGLERLIANHKTLDELRSEVKSQGYCTLLEDGILKAACGLTTIEEVIAAVELF